MTNDESSSFRILKSEYTRTNNKVIGKARFPSLLTELWNMDAVKTKINLVKSFMKADVSEFNPNAIDRSRILRSNTSIAASSLNIGTTTLNSHLVDSSLGPSASSTLTNNDQTISYERSMLNNGSSESSITSFASSHEAISALNRVLQETITVFRRCSYA